MDDITAFQAGEWCSIPNFGVSPHNTNESLGKTPDTAFAYTCDAQELSIALDETICQMV